MEVNGIFVETAEEIRNASIVGGSVNDAGNLVLTNGAGTEINAGSVINPAVIVVANQAARDALDSIVGMLVYRNDTDNVEVQTETGWSILLKDKSTAPIIVGSGGSAPAFQNSWASPPIYGVNNPLRFNLDALGHLWIRGGTSGGTPDGSTCFTLPVGYRPTYETGVLVNAGSINASGTWYQSTTTASIYTNGEVHIRYDALANAVFNCCIPLYA